MEQTPSSSWYQGRGGENLISFPAGLKEHTFKARKNHKSLQLQYIINFSTICFDIFKDSFYVTSFISYVIVISSKMFLSFPATFFGQLDQLLNLSVPFFYRENLKAHFLSVLKY